MNNNKFPQKVETKKDQQIRPSEDPFVRRSEEELKCVSLPYRLAGQGKLSKFLIYI